MESQNVYLNYLSAIADIFAILGVTIFTLISSLRKGGGELGLKINLYLSYALRALVIVILGLLIHWVVNSFEETFTADKMGAPFSFVIAVYLFSYTIQAVSIWNIGTIVWTSSTRYAIHFLNLLLPAGLKMKASDARLEILSAIYGTSADRRIDVTGVLASMIVGNQLVTIANNSLAGDPDPGNAKTLTVIYRDGFKEHSATFAEHAQVILKVS